jgi:rare lipoprotein A
MIRQHSAAIPKVRKMTAPDPSDLASSRAVERAVPLMARPFLGLLQWAALCAAGSLAACTAPPAPSTSTARIASPAPASRIDPARQEAIRLSQLPALPAPHGNHPPIDHSGRKETGKASFYAQHFDGRKTANGERFNPNTNTAASKTLPIGTTAKVINLATGKAATVTVNDRGPYVAGRTLDVSPKVAAKLKMKHSGVAPVVVEPISVPQPDGKVKLGAGAATAPPKAIQAAVQTTKRVTEQSGTDSTAP